MLDFQKLEDNQEQTLKLNKISAAILEKLVDWLNQHKDEPEIEDMNFDVDEWEEEFISACTVAELFDILRATYYLEIRKLGEITAMSLANLINGRSVQEIEHIFRLKDEKSEVVLMEDEQFHEQLKSIFYDLPEEKFAVEELASKFQSNCTGKNFFSRMNVDNM